MYSQWGSFFKLENMSGNWLCFQACLMIYKDYVYYIKWLKILIKKKYFEFESNLSYWEILFKMIINGMNH